MEKELQIQHAVESGEIIPERAQLEIEKARKQSQEAIEEIDIPDFIDEALHSGNYKILKTTPKLSMLNTLLLPTQKDGYETDSNAELEEIVKRFLCDDHIFFLRDSKLNLNYL